MPSFSLMKSFTTIFLCCLFLYIPLSYSQELKLQKGMTLKYDIVKGHDSMQLKVMIKEVAPEFVFDFLLRSKSSFYGRVTMTPDALKNGLRQYNYSVKGDVTLTDAVAVLMSQYAYSTLKDSAVLTMSPDRKEKTFRRKELLNYPMMQDKKNISIPAFLVESDDSTKDVFVIADNKSFPVILRMNLGFEFDLKEVISVEPSPR